MFEGDVLKFHKPGENPQIDPAVRIFFLAYFLFLFLTLFVQLMAAHLKATGGVVKTRFPPEPNGFLHIGHAKAMNFNFRYAEVNKGHCYLRYDDTNPEAEDLNYFTRYLLFFSFFFL